MNTRTEHRHFVRCALFEPCRILLAPGAHMLTACRSSCGTGKTRCRSTSLSRRGQVPDAPSSSSTRAWRFQCGVRLVLCGSGWLVPLDALGAYVEPTLARASAPVWIVRSGGSDGAL